MLPRMKALPLAIGLCLLGLACGDDESGTGGAGGQGASGAGGNAAQACDGAMAVLQKDAYRELAGRSSELWPPHTTTELAWSCEPDKVLRTSFQANHGTEPGDTDENGNVFLVDVGQLAVSGTESALGALSEAYDACACTTQFLSLDALGDQAVQDLVNALASYITMNLTCTGAVDAMGLVGLLQIGEIDAVIAELPNCTWTGATDWSGGFDEALSAIIAAAMETLDDYHVCNNDALLQAKLIDTFVTTGEVVACDGDDAICHGPAWFYTP